MGFIDFTFYCFGIHLLHYLAPVGNTKINGCLPFVVTGEVAEFESCLGEVVLAKVVVLH